MRRSVAVVGGGVAGALLTLRLAELLGGARVELYLGAATRHRDATAASGGLVRGFETNLDDCRLAAESLAELRRDPALARAAGYRESTSSYFLRPGADPEHQLALLDDLLGGSARLVPAAEAARTLGLAPRPEGTFAVVERHAGHVRPDAMRHHALTRAAAAGARVHPETVDSVTAGPAVTVGGVARQRDVVVVAAGAWSDALVPVPLRNRRIQYGVYPLARPDLGCLVDDVSTLYGRCHEAGSVLLGVATSAWGAPPGDDRVDPAYLDRVSDVARSVLALDGPLPPPRLSVAGVDCFAGQGGLRLRPVDGMPGVFSFTGGAGGAAKSVLASSRLAAAAVCASIDVEPPQMFEHPVPVSRGRGEQASR
ncbi:FAD-dependent oxidoreductase [Micromonospora sp. WMMD1076]|uniref:FAD-dependent oxidoreductase n=1 Tax=Micromonospora sp. WMMD1076 TaxID=3016103 RepID=UPI00249ABE05|nr:FAD-dependent oxidoreductase [Micromonospora sp. WMMD1076]WFF09151.1 FAD-dependent oxidoreductase [Micromonospora sp. WMMD1076]